MAKSTLQVAKTIWENCTHSASGLTTIFQYALSGNAFGLDIHPISGDLYVAASFSRMWLDSYGLPLQFPVTTWVDLPDNAKNLAFSPLGEAFITEGISLDASISGVQAHRCSHGTQVLPHQSQVQI
jgi:hypothetical protein